MPRDIATRLTIEPERPADAAAAEALVERAFGPGRYAKAAERLREGNRFLPEVSFVARLDGAVAGTVRLWPVRIGEREALLLGPIAVESSARSKGLGAQLASSACAAAAALGHAVVLLVGDLGFFGPLGFEALPPGSVRLPGPVDEGRVLARALVPGALEGLAGAVTLPRQAPRP